MLVCIDAGHGKNTAGKRSPDKSFFEYEFNRYVASRIKYHLERHGVKVLLTAPNDEDVALTTRCAIANNANADIFVSIHANAYGDGKNWTSPSGWEVFYSDGSKEGIKLAQAIHSENIPAVGLRDRGIKSTSEFTVVRKTKMPAVLIEHFFFTNKEELTKCNTLEYREKFAILDTKGILKYLNVEWVDEKSEEPKVFYRVQLGYFSNKQNAINLRNKLIEDGYEAIIKEEIEDGKKN